MKEGGKGEGQKVNGSVNLTFPIPPLPFYPFPFPAVLVTM